MIVWYLLSLIFIASPFLPATGYPHWFFRTADFVRLQSIVIELLLLVVFIFFGNKGSIFQWTFVLLLLLAMSYQIHKVSRYSSYYSRKKPHLPKDGSVSILAANVLQTNTNFSEFINLVHDYDTDLVLTMESNKAWEDALAPIEERYPHSVKVPLENFYGMHLYSKHPLNNVSVNYQIEEEVPSIYFDLELTGTPIFFACLHPAPPSPTENETSKERDAELMLTAKHIRSLDKPTVVCGDMNDVVWSRVSRLFKKMTGMIDPRIGRGYFPTYHANYWFMRFPLDHLFHTKDLFIGRMERTPHFGSDHFGMYYEIHHKKKAVTPANPKINKDDKEFAKELIERVEGDSKPHVLKLT